MIRTLENYKKGENVYVHSNDPRETDFTGIVKASGKQYVTVGYPTHEGVFGRFNVSNGHHENWSTWEVFHSEEEYKEFAEQTKRRKRFLDIAERHGFTDEEIDTILNLYDLRTNKQ